MRFHSNSIYKRFVTRISRTIVKDYVLNWNEIAWNVGWEVSINFEKLCKFVKLELGWKYKNLALCSTFAINIFHNFQISYYSKIAKRKTSLRSKNNCHVCNIPINLENSSDFVTCGSCNKSPICRNLHCAIWSDKSKVWDCKLCRSFLNGSGSACDWLISQLNERLLQGKSADSHNKIVWNQANSNGEIILIVIKTRVSN